jgi:hypothetical protein
VTMSNAWMPGLIESRERLAEIAEILAASLMRLKARKSSALFADLRDSSLDCPARQSGHPTTVDRRTSNG